MRLREMWLSLMWLRENKIIIKLLHSPMQVFYFIFHYHSTKLLTNRKPNIFLFIYIWTVTGRVEELMSQELVLKMHLDTKNSQPSSALEKSCIPQVQADDYCLCILLADILWLHLSWPLLTIWFWTENHFTVNTSSKEDIKRKKISILVTFSMNSNKNKICEKILSGWLHSVRKLYKKTHHDKVDKRMPWSIYNDCSSQMNLYESAWPSWCQSMMLLA